MRGWGACLVGCWLLANSSLALAQEAEPLLAFNFESDHDFDDFISPMTNPVFFEDPRMLTEARFIFANHQLPEILGGDSVQLYALQIRARLTENLSFIATKDGFFVSQSAILDDGWADLAAGLKLSLFTDPDRQFLLSTGFTFELPPGKTARCRGTATASLTCS